MGKDYRIGIYDWIYLKGGTMSEKKTTEANEEKALSVFSSDRNEDITALILTLITTFIVLACTKWFV